jgi:uncharacterized protein Usg
MESSKSLELQLTEAEIELEGPLHSVTVAHARLIKAAEIRAVNV